MEYFYEVKRYDSDSDTMVRIHTCTKLDEAEKEWNCSSTACMIEVWRDKTHLRTLYTQDDIDGFRTSLERSFSWKPDKTVKKKDPINPPHYQNFFEIAAPDFDKELERDLFLGLQWLETQCRIRRYRVNPDHFIAAVELQIRKYLDRNGEKDEELQELEKGLWYYKFMVAYIKNGRKPILVADIDEILKR